MLKTTSLPGNHASQCKGGGLRVKGREGVAPAQDSELQKKNRRDILGANTMQSKNVLVSLKRRARRGRKFECCREMQSSDVDEMHAACARLKASRGASLLFRGFYDR